MIDLRKIVKGKSTAHGAIEVEVSDKFLGGFVYVYMDYVEQYPHKQTFYKERAIQKLSALNLINSELIAKS